jgi:WD40 repeat protein/cell division protein FtsB
MAKLFVSYSRRDSVAARKLIEAFRSIEQDVWVDWESIPPAVDWLEQIFRGIEESDAFIFLISPDSIASEVCKVELNRAAQNNKRIIPIVLRDVQPKDTPESIRKLNWTFIRENDKFEEGLAKVKTAIELDLDWLEEHRRLLVRSLEWHRRKDPSLLLRGRDLRNARHMVATATAKDPVPTELQQKFIQYSSQSERNRIITFFVTGFAVIALAVLSFLATQARDEAQVQRDLAVTAQVEEARQRQIAVTAQAEEAKQRQIAVTAQAEEAIQRQIAEQNEIEAEAQRSAARAQIYQSRPGELFTSTLLAVDSVRRFPSDEAEEILRRNIRRLPLPVAQLSQAGRINDLAFNRERSVFVTASSDGTACAWGIATKVTKIFCTPSDQPAVNAVAFSPDGSLIAMGDQSGLVQILESTTGSVLHAYRRIEPRNNTVEFVDLQKGDLPADATPLEFPARRISFHPVSGQQLAVAYDDGQIPVFNALTGKISSPLYTGRRPNVMGFSPNGAWLVVGSESGGVSIWNLANSNEKLPSFLHRGGVQALAFSSKDNRLATAGNDNTAMIGLSIKKELFRIGNQTLIRDLAFSPDGSRLVTVSADRRIRIWDALNGVERLAMAQDGSVTEVVFSSDARWLATTGDDRTARVWDAATGEEIFQIPLKASGAILAFCNDNKWLITTDESGAIEIWDISIIMVPDLSLSAPSKSLVDQVQYSPSGQRLAVSSENNFWVLTSDPETVLKERELREQSSPFSSNIKKLVFSPDSTQLGLLTEGNELAIYDVERKALEKLPISGIVQDIAFSPDSQQLIISDVDGNLQAWDIASGQWSENPLQADGPVSSLAASSQFLAMASTDQIHITGPDGNGGIPSIGGSAEDGLLIFSQDGSLLASTDTTGRIAIWRYQDGKFTAVASFNRERAVSLAFHPDGILFAVGTANQVYLMDLEGKELARIPHRDTVNSVSFSAEGKYLATASSTLLQVWELNKIELIKSDELIPAACSRLFENFDPAQWSTFFGNEKYKTLCESLPVPE